MRVSIKAKDSEKRLQDSGSTKPNCVVYMNIVKNAMRGRATVTRHLKLAETEQAIFHVSQIIFFH